MSRAARRAWRHPASAPPAAPKIAIRPSPRYLSMAPSWRSIASPTSIENEHHVIGQPLLADHGEAARIEEQYRQVALDALRMTGRLTASAHSRRRGDQARDRDGLARPDLAGEPHVRRSHDAGERHGFGAGRRHEI